MRACHCRPAMLPPYYFIPLLRSYEPKEKQGHRELFVAYIAPYHYNGLQ